MSLRLVSQLWKPCIQARAYTTKIKDRSLKKKGVKSTKRAKKTSVFKMKVSQGLNAILTQPNSTRAEQTGIAVKMKRYIEILNGIPAGELRAIFMHKQMDNLAVIEEKEASKLTPVPPPIQCKKGCSFCCSRIVPVTTDEAELLVTRLEAQDGGTILPRRIQYLEDQAEYPLNQEFQYLALPPAIKACIFLTPQGECSVYTSRPAACRIHQVTSEPIHCSPEEGTKVPKFVISPRREILFSASAELEDRLGNKMDTMSRAMLKVIKARLKDPMTPRQRTTKMMNEVVKKTRYEHPTPAKSTSARSTTKDSATTNDTDTPTPTPQQIMNLIIKSSRHKPKLS